MKNQNCGDCKDSKQGKAYIDQETGLLCVEILEKYDIPLVRLKTNGSMEKEVICDELNRIYNIK